MTPDKGSCCGAISVGGRNPGKPDLSHSRERIVCVSSKAGWRLSVLSRWTGFSQSMNKNPKATLNESQQRALRISCAYIDELLEDIELVLSAAQSKAVFPKYIDDITPAQRKTIEDHIARIRAQVVRVLAGQAIEIDKPRITASHAIHTTLTFVEVNIEELSPGRMRGYGEVSRAGAVDLNGIRQELQSVVTELQRYLHQRDGPQATCDGRSH